jgi:glucosamine--fructose-6-phosphate aminotransferase (isomerizing)
MEIDHWKKCLYPIRNEGFFEMMPKGIYTQSEIDSQPMVWRSILKEYAQTEIVLPSDLYDVKGKYFLVTGCGSTHYLSISVATILRKLGFQALALPAAELVYFSEALPPGEPILVTISRSGKTTETLNAVDNYRKQKKGHTVIAVTTQPDSILAKEANFILAASQAKEVSVAQTRSFTSMFLLSQILSGAIANDQNVAERLQALPSALEKLITQASDLPRQIGEDLSLNRFFFLGGGPLYGLACEAMLKTKEMTCSWSEAYHPLEIRHGPVSVVNEETLVVGFMSDSQLEAEAKVLREMKQLGAKTMVMIEDFNEFDRTGIDYVFQLKTGLNEWERGAIYLPLVQWIAYYRALAKGLDPDRPKHLTAVVEF